MRRLVLVSMLALIMLITGDGQNKVDLGDVYNSGGDSNDDVGVDDVGQGQC